MADQIKTKQWTDQSLSDPGKALYDACAELVDESQNESDYKLSELRLSTVTERLNAQAILDLIGYQMKGVASARMRIRINRKVGSDGVPKGEGQTIPAYTQWQVTTQNPTQVFNFYNLSEIVIGKSDLHVDAELVEGSPELQSFVLSDPNEHEFTVANIDAYLPSIRVYTLSGSDPQVNWSVVNSWELNDDAYDVAANQVPLVPKNCAILQGDSELVVSFPPHWQRALVEDASGEANVLFVQYLSSQGAAANIAFERIVEVEQFGQNENIASIVPLSAASGGAARETVEQARRAAPVRFQTRGSGSLTALEAAALQQPGVIKANAVDIYEAPTLVPAANKVLISYLEEQELYPMRASDLPGTSVSLPTQEQAVSLHAAIAGEAAATVTLTELYGVPDSTELEPLETRIAKIDPRRHVDETFDRWVIKCKLTRRDRSETVASVKKKLASYLVAANPLSGLSFGAGVSYIEVITDLLTRATQGNLLLSDAKIARIGTALVYASYVYQDPDTKVVETRNVVITYRYLNNGVDAPDASTVDKTVVKDVVNSDSSTTPTTFHYKEPKDLRIKAIFDWLQGISSLPGECRVLSKEDSAVVVYDGYYDYDLSIVGRTLATTPWVVGNLVDTVAQVAVPDLDLINLETQGSDIYSWVEVL